MPGEDKEGIHFQRNAALPNLRNTELSAFVLRRNKEYVPQSSFLSLIKKPTFFGQDLISDPFARTWWRPQDKQHTATFLSPCSTFYFLPAPPSPSASFTASLHRQSCCFSEKVHLLPSTSSTDTTHTLLVGKGTELSGAVLLSRDALLRSLFLSSSCFTLSLCRRSWLASRSLCRCSISIL